MPITLFQDIVGERTDKKNNSGNFEGWLAKEVGDLCKRASCSVPEHFPKYSIWKWEVCCLVSCL